MDAVKGDRESPIAMARGFAQLEDLRPALRSLHTQLVEKVAARATDLAGGIEREPPCLVRVAVTRQCGADKILIGETQR